MPDSRYLIIALLLIASPTLAQSPTKQIERANELFAEQKLDEAESLYTTVAEEVGDSPAINFNLACIHLARDERPEARTRLRRVLHGAAGNGLLAAAHYNLGHIAVADATEQAGEDIDKALGSLDAAEQAFRTSLRLNPGDPDTARNIEVVQRLRAQFQEQQEQEQQQQQQDQQNQDQEQDQEQDEEQDEQQQSQSGDQEQNEDQQQQDQQQQDGSEQEPSDEQQQQSGEEQQQQQQDADQQSQAEQQAGDEQQQQSAQDAKEAAEEQAQRQLEQFIARILDKERREREERARLRALRRVRTEKDW